MMETECKERDGAWQGVPCREIECPQPTACCFSDGSCRDLRPRDCVRRGGTVHDSGTCADVSCPQPWACCVHLGGCRMDLEDECLDQGGQRQEGSTCDADECPPRQACCEADGDCFEISERACQDRSGPGMPRATATPLNARSRAPVASTWETAPIFWNQPV